MLDIEIPLHHVAGVNEPAVCRDRLVMFGCIDPGDTPAPSVDWVKQRVRQALRYLDPQRLLLAPDCGLMTISRPFATPSRYRPSKVSIRI